MTDDLDCVFCGRWFPTFQTMAAHVKRAHAHARDGDVTSAIGRALTRPEEEDAAMALPKPTAPARQEATTRERRERRDFLKASHVGKAGTRVTIQCAGNVKVVDGNFGPQAVVDCEYEGKPFVFAVNVDSPNYTLMIERFTDDERNWFGPVDLIVKEGATSSYLVVADGQGQSDGTAKEKPAGRKRRT